MQPSESSLAAEIRHDGGKKGINLLRKLLNEQTLLGIMAFACPQHCKTGPGINSPLSLEGGKQLS